MSAFWAATALLDGGELKCAVASDIASDDFVSLSCRATLIYERVAWVVAAAAGAFLGVRRV